MGATARDAVPVKVSLVDIGDGIQDRLTPTRKVNRDRPFTTNSYPLAVGNVPVQILANAPKRAYATIICNGNGYLAIGTSDAECQSAATAGLNEFIGSVTYIDASKMQAPIRLCGTTDLWAVLIVVGTNPTVVSVIKELNT